LKKEAFLAQSAPLAYISGGRFYQENAI